MRFLMVMIVAAAGLAPTSCADPVDDTPLGGTQGGLSALRWGDGPEEVQRRMLEMPDVSLIRDTIEIHAFAAWQTPDTVEAPAIIPRYRLMQFQGGTFLGYSVEQWYVTLENAASLRQIEVVLGPLEDAGKDRWKVRRKLHQFYGSSSGPDLDPDRFYADDWSSPASTPSTARTEVRIGRYGSWITIGFTDREWDDRRWEAISGKARRRMHVDEWRRYLAALVKERGWKMEDLPPQ